MTLENQLTRAIAERVDSTSPPVPDLSDAVRRGRSLRRRRTTATVAAIAVLAAGGAWLVPHVDGLFAPKPQLLAPVGRLDYSHGLRAFASPDEDGEVSIGGRSFPVADMGYLDTDATATSYGLVFFDPDMRAHLLSEDGTDLALAPAPAEGGVRMRPSAKADARLPLVAFSQPAADGVTVRLYDLEARQSVDTVDVPCTGARCAEVRVDGVDRGLVFVRTGTGTYVWDPKARGDRRWTVLGTGDFRVADVRNGRVLWYATPPSPGPDSPVAHWDFTRGAIDAELSYDGRHVLYWSTRLRPTEPGDRPIRLQVRHAGWFAFDTDGSVLVAGVGRGDRNPVYDCEVPSGACEQIGSVSTRSGDPMFIGNDM